MKGQIGDSRIQYPVPHLGDTDALHALNHAERYAPVQGKGHVGPLKALGQ